MVPKITNLHIIKHLPIHQLCLIECYTIDNQRYTYTTSKKTTERETVNHLSYIDLIIDRPHEPLAESLIKELRTILRSCLKSGTADSRGRTACHQSREIVQSLSQILLVKLLYPIERNHLQVVVQIRMDGSRDNQQLLVAAGEFFINGLAEIARMGLLPMDEQHRTADFTGIRKDWHVNHREDSGSIETFVRAQ